MKKKEFILGIVALTAMNLQTAFASPQNVGIDWRYQDAKTGERITDRSEVTLPSLADLQPQERFTTDSRMEKALFLVDLTNTFKQTLKQYEEACKCKGGA